MPHSHHSHSGQFCRHAKDQLEDVVKEAIRQRFEVYGLTEHAPRYRVEDLYPEEADLSLSDLRTTYQSFLQTALALKSKYASQITLLIGLESDFVTELDLSRTIDLIDIYPEIDYIVGSVHHVGGIPIDFDRETWLRAVYAAGRGEDGSMMTADAQGSLHTIPLDKFKPQLQASYTPCPSDLRPFILAYLDQQLHMIQRLRPEVIGHFDLFRLYTPELDVRSAGLNPAGDRGVWEAVERNIREIVGYGGLFELNTAAFRKGWDTAYPCRLIANRIISSGGKFCFSDDSHGVAQVGLNYHRLRSYAESLGVKDVSYLSPLAQASSVQPRPQIDQHISEGNQSRLLDRRTEMRVAVDIWGHPFWEGHA